MIRHPSRALALALALTGTAAVMPATALAQDKCTMPDGEVIRAMDNAEFERQLDAIQEHLDEFRLNDARYVLQTLKGNLRCLVEPAHPIDVARFARLNAQMAFFDQDEITATRWAFLAEYTVPDMPWPKEIAPQHPLRDMLSYADEPPAAGPTDMVVAPPKKGMILMNGWMLSIPQARAEVPNLVQVFDKKGRLVEAYWQDGGAFHEEWLEPDDGKGREVEPAKWYVPPDVDAVVEKMKEDPAYRVDDEIAMGEESDFEIQVPPSDGGDASASTDEPPPPVAPTTTPDPIADAKPPKKTGSGGGPNGVLLGTGVGAALAAGAMYGVAFLQESTLADSADEAEMMRKRHMANQLVVGSGVAGVAAVGLGVTAFVVDDSPGLGLGFRW